MRLLSALLLFIGGVSLAAQEATEPQTKKDAVAVDKDLLADVEDSKPLQDATQNAKEAAAYSGLLRHVRAVPDAALVKAARSDVAYAKLMEEPAKYRGEPIHIKGRLRRLARMDAPPDLVKDGTKAVYQAWIFPEGGEAGSDPYCVVFVEIPKGVEPAEKTAYRISCDAFFFKRLRYKSVAGDMREAPLLIGRSPQLQKSE